MNKILSKNKLFLAGMITLLFAACEDGDQVFDQIVAAEQRGAVLRTINLNSNELPIGSTDANFSVDLEVQDQENGTLVENVEVYIGFLDNSDEVGTGTNVEESLAETINSSTFTIGEFGLPRFSYSIGLSELLSFVGRSESDITGGDQFTIRFALVLSDGRRFSAADNSGTLTGSYFNSPFSYSPTVICPIPDTSFVGSYLIEQTSAEVDGFTLSSGTVVELSVGETSTTRVFDTFNYPTYCSTTNPFSFELICGEIVIPNQNSNCACGDGGDWFTDAIVRETYDVNDDSSFSITFTDDAQSNCGSPVQTTYLFTKQ